mmetsp:Transcript_15375/g.48457  ORF Transcript_15375/g.48457 Transcript_15375/m.48457 type:complete len:237 (-) Transcript_15375:158-868(-)
MKQLKRSQTRRLGELGFMMHRARQLRVSATRIIWPVVPWMMVGGVMNALEKPRRTCGEHCSDHTGHSRGTSSPSSISGFSSRLERTEVMLRRRAEATRSRAAVVLLVVAAEHTDWRDSSRVRSSRGTARVDIPEPRESASMGMSPMLSSEATASPRVTTSSSCAPGPALLPAPAGRVCMPQAMQETPPPWPPEGASARWATARGPSWAAEGWAQAAGSGWAPLRRARRASFSSVKA